jgi:hypothetical protein
VPENSSQSVPDESKQKKFSSGQKSIQSRKDNNHYLHVPIFTIKKTGKKGMFIKRHQDCAWEGAGKTPQGYLI